MKMKSKLLILVLLFGAISVLAQDKTDNENRVKFNPAADPFADVKTAVIKAMAENKNIILDVGGEWCIWCHRLDAFIDNNNEIKDFIGENFVTVKVNYSEENKNEKFLSQYPKVAGYPHIFVLGKKGKLLVSKNTGELELEKSYSAEKIMEFLRQWAPKKKNK